MGNFLLFLEIVNKSYIYMDMHIACLHSGMCKRNVGCAYEAANFSFVQRLLLYVLQTQVYNRIEVFIVSHIRLQSLFGRNFRWVHYTVISQLPACINTKPKFVALRNTASFNHQEYSWFYYKLLAEEIFGCGCHV